MRPCRPPPSPLYPMIRFAFTDHPITVWAGAILLRLYFELIRLRTTLEPVLAPFTKTSNNQIPAVDVLLAWWYGLALGAERFEHLTRYRQDPLLPRLLGLPRFPAPDTLRRFFQGFTYRRTTEVSEALLRLSLVKFQQRYQTRHWGFRNLLKCVGCLSLEHPQIYGPNAMNGEGRQDGHDPHKINVFARSYVRIGTFVGI